MDEVELERLRRSVTGPVIVDGDPDFDDARRTFNAMVDHRPRLIVRTTDHRDVAATITAANDAALPLGVRGGGHSVAGLAIVEGGAVIDLSRMRTVEVDAEARVASVAGGAQWLDVDAALHAHGLATPGGVFGDTGVGGLTLGGGIGFLMGIGGFTCDNLVGAQVVTADGSLVEAADDPELLWALRGGGGNFGVVTRFDLAAYPVGPTFGGKVDVPLGDGSALRRLAAMMLTAPDELLPMVYVFRAEDGTPMLQLQFSFVGSADDGARWATTILGHDAVRHPELRSGTYLDIQSINPIEAFGARNYWTSTFVTDLEDALVDLIVDVASSIPNSLSGILIEPIHGDARRRDPGHSAFSHRIARFHVTAVGIWKDPAFDAVGTAWSKGVTARVRDWSTGGLYVNYSMLDEQVVARADDRARAAYPASVYARLQAVKRRYDPDNRFRSNLNVLPGSPPS